MKHLICLIAIVGITHAAQADDPSETFFQFDGKTQFVRTKFEYKGNHPITVDAVIAPAQLDTPQTFVGDIESAGFALMIYKRRYEFRVHNGDTYIKARSETVPTPGEKIHLTGIFDGRNVAIFVNGKQEAKTAFTGKIKLSERPVALAADPTTRTKMQDYFQGRFYEARVLNQAILPVVKRGKVGLIQNRKTIAAEVFHADFSKTTRVSSDE